MDICFLLLAELWGRGPQLRRQLCACACLSLFCMDLPLDLCEGVYAYVHNILYMTMLIVTTAVMLIYDYDGFVS